jgi:hypothetical protein
MIPTWITFIAGLVLTIAFFVIFISNYCGWSCWRRWFEHKDPIKLPAFSQIKAEVREMPTEQLLTLSLLLLFLVGSTSLLAPFLFPAGTPDYVRDIWICLFMIPIILSGMIMVIRDENPFTRRYKKPGETAAVGMVFVIFSCLLILLTLYDLIKRFFE